MEDALPPTWSVKTNGVLAIGFPTFDFAAAEARRYGGVVIDSEGNEIDPASIEVFEVPVVEPVVEPVPAPVVVEPVVEPAPAPVPAASDEDPEIAAIAALIEADEKANKQGRKPKN